MRWRVANDFPDKSGMYITEVIIIDNGQTYRPVAYNSYNAILNKWYNVRACYESGEVSKWLDEKLNNEQEVKECDATNVK